MADPLSIIGTAGAIANIIDVLTKTITTVCDMRQAWKIADLSIFAFENQLNLLKIALFEIQKWTLSRSSEQSHQLVMQVDSCVTCCRLLIGKIDGEVSQFQKTTAGDLELGSKLSFLFKTKDMEQIQRMVDQQTHTLTLLLTACNSNALEEQTRILQQPKLVRALQDMDRDTASLIVHRDSDSIITATSVSSSRWSFQFAFDRELFITKVYDKWIRKLATTQRSARHGSEDTTSSPTNGQQTALTRTETAASEEPSRSSESSGERRNTLARTTMGIEMQPLRQTRTRSSLELQSKESHRIDKNLRRDMKSASLEVKYLAKKLLVDEATREDSIRTCLEDVLICHKEDLDLDNGFEPWVVQIFRTIMEHPATKVLMADETFVLPDAVAYFLNQIEKIMQDDYIPTDWDAISCPTPLPGCVEASFNMGQLTMRLTDPGNATVNRTKLFPQLETAFAVIYVFDLSSFSFEALLQFESTVNSHWLRNSSIIVIFNNFKGFSKRLAEEPLSDEFPNYAGGDDQQNASIYILAKINNLNRAHLRLYAHFIDGVYDEKNLLNVWRNIQDIIVERALENLKPK
ncbi:GNA-3 g alpha subunit GNA-3 [Fusarium pseudoanthophilum]|uniref:GNA-3 g alpha subunit GNA-3 n=1 Tax=Fusarium pseudoanthophilum TaxID=48495 RepID=A0A8H5KIF0_9HYPO|nr:GNA-3 g alpha subunit GNA-3 [Fusarium pseudoanthophilum]